MTEAAKHLADQLKALLWKLDLEQDDLRERLLPHSGRKSIAASQFSNAVHERLSASGRVFKALSRAVTQFAKSSTPSIDLPNLVQEYSAIHSLKTPHGNNRVLSRLKGSWFLCQYRGKREARKDGPPETDVRLAVLVFGRNAADLVT